MLSLTLTHLSPTHALKLELDSVGSANSEKNELFVFLAIFIYQSNCTIIMNTKHHANTVNHPPQCQTVDF